MWSRKQLAIAATWLFVFLTCFHTGLEAQAPRAYKTWSDYGGGSDSSKFVALDQITKANVNQLQVAWKD